MDMPVLGIDIAKETFDVALRHGESTDTGNFPNTQRGFEKLSRWLANRETHSVHACLEATGRYGERVALYLDACGHKVSVVNPARIAAYAESKLQRNKTDQQDARLIADFCATQTPARWRPASPEQRELQDIVRQVAALTQERQRARNRLQAGIETPVVVETIETQIAFLDTQIARLEDRIMAHIAANPQLQEKLDLLVSIPGIGETTAAKFLAEVPDVSQFDQAPQLAAYAGLTPRQHHSGSSVHKPSHMSKTGNVYLRTMFFMPALSAKQHNPIIKDLVQRLEARDKHKMTIVGAVMRKLLHLCYGVLKTGKPFDPHHAQKRQNAA